MLALYRIPAQEGARFNCVPTSAEEQEAQITLITLSLLTSGEMTPGGRMVLETGQGFYLNPYLSTRRLFYAN